MAYKIKVLSVLLTVVAFFSLNTICAAEIKIGIIDFKRITKESSAGKMASNEINKTGRQMEDDLQKKGNDIKSLDEKLEKERPVMNQRNVEEKERELRIMVNDLKTLQKKYQQDIRNLEQEWTEKLMGETMKIANEIGKKEKYTLIMEKAIVIYSPDQIDITDKVIQELNKQFASKSN